MADTLLFRKGPLSGLANLPIKNGAISITTDEPGIYIDHNGKRSRVGDFIVVPNMAALDDYKLDVTDESKRYNAHALYYVVADDALARWDGTKFALINDRSSLVDSLAKLNTALSGLTTIVENQGKSITANATAIATEKSRAETAEKALDDKIKAITSGTDGTTLASLKAAIEAEEDRAMAAEAANAAAAKKAQDEVDALEGVVGTEAANSGLFKKINDEITRATNKENKLASDIKANATAIGTEKDRAMEEEGRLAGLITSNATTAANAVNDEKERAMAEEDRIEALIDAEVTRAMGAENAISVVANDAQSKANQNALDIAGLQSADTTITNRIAAEETRAKNAESNLSGRIDDLVTEAAKHALKTEVKAVDDKVDALTTRVGTAEGDIQNITKQIGLLDKAIDDEVKERKREITRVEGLISKEAGAREAAITQEVVDRNTAITNAVNAAKTELNQTITGNTTNIQKNATAISKEIARAKAAEKTNSDAIAKLRTDLTTESTTARAAEEANAKAIVAEKTRAMEAESGLDNKITKAREDLTEAISDEAKTRASEDTRILSEAKEYADGLLEASSAMHYKGEVSVKADLPTADVEAGDTYVVADPGFTLVSGEAYKVGDLLVAKNDSVSGTAYPASGWSHVKTGYDASLDQSLTVTAATNGATAALSSVAGSGNKGSLTIVGNANSNVKASLSGSTLTINMEWEEWT